MADKDGARMLGGDEGVADAAGQLGVVLVGDAAANVIGFEGAHSISLCISIRQILTRLKKAWTARDLPLEEEVSLQMNAHPNTSSPDPPAPSPA